MMVMPSNNTGGMIHYLAGRYPNKIGLCISPDGWRNPPFYMPYAIDNGAFTNWQPDLFMKILEKTTKLHKPLWIVVPDLVRDAKATMERWNEWHKKVKPYGPLAFACQDGMNPENVPKEAYCCFIGGTTHWKLRNAHRFKKVRPWLHIGRVNTYQRLMWAEDIGADSVDGTGFFRGDKNQLAGLIEFFERKQEKLDLEFQKKEMK